MEGAFDAADRPGGTLRADRVHLAGLRCRPAGVATRDSSRCWCCATSSGFRASETAEMLDDDGAVGQQRPGPGAHELGPTPSARSDETSGRRRPGPRRRRRSRPGSSRRTSRPTWRALVDLFTDDIFLSMPPLPLEYDGRDVVTRFFELPAGARPPLPAGPDPGQRGAGLRCLRPGRRRRAAGHRPVHDEPDRRPDPRDERFEAHVLAMVRAAAVPALAIAGAQFRARVVSVSSDRHSHATRRTQHGHDRDHHQHLARRSRRRTRTGRRTSAAAAGSPGSAARTSAPGPSSRPTRRKGAAALLLGRRSDAWFAPRWPTRATASGRTGSTPCPKYVVSATIDQPQWTQRHRAERRRGRRGRAAEAAGRR